MSDQGQSQASGGAATGSSSTKPASIEYTSEEELIAEFRKCMRDPEQKEAAIQYLYESVLDETILGVVFEVHFAVKTGILAALEGEPEDPKPFSIVSQPDFDVFGANSTKIAMDCTCPKCERAVAASRFAPHLEKCMGKWWLTSEIRYFHKFLLITIDYFPILFTRNGPQFVAHRQSTHCQQSRGRQLLWIGDQR